MVKQLGDPYSTYLDNQDFAALNTMTEGHFGGVGMVMGMKDDHTFVVVSPIEDTPAYKAGIKSGDVLLQIDGKELAGESLSDVVKQIRGQDGTQVQLLLQRGKKNLRPTPLPGDIKIKSVYGKMEDGNIGYIRITNFSEDTGKDFQAELKKLEDQE